MPTTSLRRPRGSLSVWHWLSAAPLLASVLLLGFAGFAAARMGAWPSPGQPDPKDVSSLLQVTTVLSVTTSFPLALAAVAGLLATRRLRLTASDLAAIAVAVASSVALYVLGSGSLGQWLFD